MGNNKVSSGVKKLIKYIETGKLDGMGLLKIVGKLLDFTQSPTEVYWAYSKYKGTSLKFKYPDGISSYDAESAITQLDSAVDAVMALLTNFGVVDASNLKGVVSGLVFTNANLTSLAKALYGALDKRLFHLISIWQALLFHLRALQAYLWIRATVKLILQQLKPSRRLRAGRKLKQSTGASRMAPQRLSRASYMHSLQFFVLSTVFSTYSLMKERLTLAISQLQRLQHL